VSFLLIASICVAAQVILFAHLGDGISEIAPRQKTTAAAVQSTGASDSSGVLSSVGAYLAILVSVTVACFGGIIYLFFKKVVIPLRSVTHAASEIAGGNLAFTVPPALRHEVGDLGQLVHDMAANFQEVLLLTGTTVGNATSSLDQIDELLRSEANPIPQSRLQEHLDSVRRDVDSLGLVLKSFKFYQTAFNGKEVKHSSLEE